MSQSVSRVHCSMGPWGTLNRSDDSRGCTEAGASACEAIALAARDAGISAVYSSASPVSNAIFEVLSARLAREERPLEREPLARACANEQAACEAALGMSLLGRRVLLVIDHGALAVVLACLVSNVTASQGTSAAIGGGLVLAVADEPAPTSPVDAHELVELLRFIMYKPADPQEAYDMVRDAFEVSERFGVPALVRLSGRLAAHRALVSTRTRALERPIRSSIMADGGDSSPFQADPDGLGVPSTRAVLRSYSEQSQFNRLELSERDRGLGVITVGVARNDYSRRLSELYSVPSHLHIGTYPVPMELVRTLARKVETLLVLEEGAPYVEGLLRSTLGMNVAVKGKLTGDVVNSREQTTDVVSCAWGLPPGADSPLRGPSLFQMSSCAECRYREMFEVLTFALYGSEESLVEPTSELPIDRGPVIEPLVFSDVYCEVLSVLRPPARGNNYVSTKASIGMAIGAVEAGYQPVVVVTGEDTFLQSGLSPLRDAIAASTRMTILVCNGGSPAMPGPFVTELSCSRIGAAVRSLGAHVSYEHHVEGGPARTKTMTKLLEREISHPGLSVILWGATRIVVLRTRIDAPLA